MECILNVQWIWLKIGQSVQNEKYKICKNVFIVDSKILKFKNNIV